MEDVAHLRHFEATNQCELAFNLKINYFEPDWIEEIQAVRQITDTVSSLIQHIKNKLTRIISLKTETARGSEIVEQTDLKIPISLKCRGKHIGGAITLIELFSIKYAKIVLTVLGHTYNVLVNAPLIKVIKLPLILYANFPVQPNKFYALYTDKAKSIYSWYKSKDKIDWIEVGQSYQYNILGDDVDHYLKLVCIPVSTIGEGIPAETISERMVKRSPTLPECPFEKRHEYTRKALQLNELRMVSYNTLANIYSDSPDQFPYCTPDALSIDYRKQLILKELLGYNADIICLQEVDNREYTNYFKEGFHVNNFGTIYNRKGNRIPEGLLLCYNKSRLKLLSSQHLVYSNEINKRKTFAHLWNLIKTNTEVVELFKKQATSLQITTLKMRETNNILIIANTHLFYHPEAPHVRLLQIFMAITYLDQLTETFATKNEDVHVVLCGDLNCNPGSSIYSFISTGKIPADNEDCLKLSDKRKNDFEHTIGFVSACGTPTYTNYTDDFKDCLDYIFIEEDKVKVKQIVPLPTEQELSQYVGLPNEVYPSDHLALVVDLEFLPQS